MGRRRLSLVCLATLASACGGGVPLLHPAHTLAPEQLSASAGLSSHFALGEPDERIETAQGSTDQGVATTPLARDDLARGAIAQALSAPGLAPFVSARVGIGHESDAGLTYSGRAARIDARYAFINDELAVAAGLGLSGVLMRPGSAEPGSLNDQEIAGVDIKGTTGGGLDIPILVGYRSTGSIATAWGGVRFGYERLGGEIRFREPDPGRIHISNLSAERFFASGIVGLGIGLKPIWVRVELAASATLGSGSLKRDRVEVVGSQPVVDKGPPINDDWFGIALTPAAALATHF